jgi:hypothetical protein
MSHVAAAMAPQKHHDCEEHARQPGNARFGRDFQNHPMFRRIECVVAELLTKGNVAAEASNSSRLLKLRHAR